ncbi:ATP-binding protein [Cellulomonas sp. HD19AZ1]|uniref:ATP-binding protein n=1 Tax=Cellulomonas sp. HD19AZ1 TaxID=2559593 RepID=UPI001070E6E2|nr:ATP-binding protein [Cellulomonas sp. HD19AZ1]TFH72953.1 DUF4435 domain-containing protein [Cellulomonas sp. HD19AZ1]
MRIVRFRIENYKGVRAATAASLEARPLTLITGRNGTGKSLILEALTAAWSGNINLPEFVGPYGSSLVIEIGLAFTAEEYELVDRWRSARALSPITRLQEHVLEVVSTNRESTGRYLQRDALIETLQNPLFSRDHPFASVDLLSARRQVSLTTTTTVDLSMLDRTTNADQRRMMYDQEIRWKSGMQMPDVGAYLTSLDYRDYVAARAGLSVNGEYSRLQQIFESATGKRITLPHYDPVTTKSSIDVELPSGVQHSLEGLSNGEREMLGMLYYVSQLSAQGGVLLLDEPEKHLHPTLQQAVLTAMMSVAGRGQVFVVTHSPTLIGGAAPDDVLVVQPAWESAGNQVCRVSDDSGHLDVLVDLGISRRELFQADLLLFVEGADDERRLRLLFPDELAGARVVVGGGREAVLRAATTLRGLAVGVPWLCVVDRDFWSDAEAEAAESGGGVFVWRARMLENVLLTEPLLKIVLVAGIAAENEQLGPVLKASVKSGFDVALGQFVEARVRKEPVADQEFPTDLAPADPVEARLWREMLAWKARLDCYADVHQRVETEMLDRWEECWHLYVDGKLVLGSLQRRIPVYKSIHVMVDALLVAARQDEALMPDECKRLRGVLCSIVSPRNRPVETPPEDFSARDAAIAVAVAGRSGDVELNMPFDEGLPGC